MYSAYVCAAVYALKSDDVIDDRCSMRLSLRAIQTHCNGDGGSVCVDLCSLAVWNGCHIGPGPSARMFILLPTCLRLKAFLLLDKV